MSVLIKKNNDKMDRVKEILEENERRRPCFTGFENLFVFDHENRDKFCNTIMEIEDPTIIKDENDLKQGFNRVLHYDSIQIFKIIKNNQFKQIGIKIPASTFYKDEKDIEILNDEMTILFDIEGNDFSYNSHVFLLIEKAEEGSYNFDRSIENGVITKESNVFNNYNHNHPLPQPKPRPIYKRDNKMWSIDEMSLDNNE